MYRLLLVLVALAGCLAWAGSSALAEGADEFQLPPVKLKPDRPSGTKPIPPTPDERTPPPSEAPKETPPAEKPTETPKPPKEEAPPAPKVEVTPPALPPPPPPPKIEIPPLELTPETPKKPPVTVRPPEKPPTLELPTEPPEEPTPLVPPTIAKPIKTTPPKPPAKAVEGPALPEPLPPKPAKPEELIVPPPGKDLRPTEVQKEIAEAQVEPQTETDLTGMGEVGLVEEVARTRKAYARALDSLKNYYRGRGNSTKTEWIESEIDAFNKVPRTQYLAVAELAGPNLRPTRRVEAADQLYKEGMNYKEYPALPPGKKDYLKVALQKFQTIIEKYPDSDKIADAAFRMGEIYGGWYFQDWGRAVQSYERCWQWDPKTPYPALLNAAKIYDEKLKNRLKAVELYNRVIAQSPDENMRKEAADRIKAITGK
jgi:TolA-binding protein